MNQPWKEFALVAATAKKAVEVNHQSLYAPILTALKISGDTMGRNRRIVLHNTRERVAVLLNQFAVSSS